MHVGTRLYGADAVTFKFHQAMHLPEMLDQYGVLVTCWVHERKHRNPKRWVNVSHNTSVDFDRFAFRDVTGQHLKRLEADDLVTWIGLKPPILKVPPEMLRDLVTVFGPFRALSASKHARVSDFEVVHDGDVVEGWNGESAFIGKVLLHVTVDGKLFTMLDAWELLEATAHYTVWSTRNAARAIVSGTDINTACTYACSGANVTVLRSSSAYRRSHSNA